MAFQFSTGSVKGPVVLTPTARGRSHTTGGGGG